jgi:hypothetical protein
MEHPSHFLRMTPTTPLLLVMHQTLTNAWVGRWRGCDGAPFQARESFDRLLWLISGTDRGAVSTWRQAITADRTINFPLHLDPAAITVLRRQRPNVLIQPQTLHPTHLGTLSLGQFYRLLAHPDSLSLLGANDHHHLLAWLQSLEKTPPDKAWLLTHGPWPTGHSAHDALSYHHLAQTLRPWGETTVQFAFFWS